MQADEFQNLDTVILVVPWILPTVRSWMVNETAITLHWLYVTSNHQINGLLQPQYTILTDHVLVRVVPGYVPGTRPLFLRQFLLPFPVRPRAAISLSFSHERLKQLEHMLYYDFKMPAFREGFW